MNLKVNLNDIWYKDPEELPEFVWYEMCIYRMHNLINDKNYIGQTRMTLVSRWWLAGLMSHLYNYEEGFQDHKYNSIRKYGTSNFEIELIEYNLDIRNLNSHEIYWIDKFESFGTKGYNKTSGGSNCECFHTEEAKNKAIESRTRIYGNPSGNLTSEWSLNKAIESKNK